MFHRKYMKDKNRMICSGFQRFGAGNEGAGVTVIYLNPTWCGSLRTWVCYFDLSLSTIFPEQGSAPLLIETLERQPSPSLGLWAERSSLSPIVGSTLHHTGTDSSKGKYEIAHGSGVRLTVQQDQPPPFAMHHWLMDTYRRTSFSVCHESSCSPGMHPLDCFWEEKKGTGIYLECWAPSGEVPLSVLIFFGARVSRVWIFLLISLEKCITEYGELRQNCYRNQDPLILISTPVIS